MNKSNKGNKRYRGNKRNGGDKSNKGYHKLIVWQRAHKFAVSVYKKTKGFPNSELYGLVNQLRRAVISVPANVVEGYSRKSKKEFLRYLNIAQGSLAECEYYLEFAKELKFLNKKDYEALDKMRGEVGFLLYKFISSLKEVD